MHLVRQIDNTCCNEYVMTYQSILCGKRAETPHALLDNIHFLEVRIVGENTLPVLIKPQLKACLWPKGIKFNFS